MTEFGWLYGGIRRSHVGRYTFVFVVAIQPVTGAAIRAAISRGFGNRKVI